MMRNAQLKTKISEADKSKKSVKSKRVRAQLLATGSHNPQTVKKSGFSCFALDLIIRGECKSQDSVNCHFIS